MEKNPKPDYGALHKWEFYPADAENEYLQCFDEGLDVEQYKRLFAEVQKLPRGEVQKQFGDALFQLIAANQPMVNVCLHINGINVHSFHPPQFLLPEFKSLPAQKRGFACIGSDRAIARHAHAQRP